MPRNIELHFGRAAGGPRDRSSIMKKLIMLGLTALCACQSTAPPNGRALPPGGEGTSYKAVGTEPFWALEISNGTMILQTPDSPNIIVTEFDARPTFNGWRYVSEKLTADIGFAPCSDGMSDRRYQHTVIVFAEGKEYHGCGGPFPPAQP